MKMSKKMVTMVVSLSVIMLLVSNVFGQAKTTLRFIGMKQAALTTEEMDAIAKEYEALNPDIKIITTYVSYDALHDKQVAALAARSKAFDFINVDCIWFPEFVEAGWLWNVSDKITPEMRKDILKASLDTVTYKGKLWGMPWLVDTKYFFYNENILNQAGISAPPRTWEEFTEQSQKIKNAGLVEYPTIWSWSQHECSVCDFVVFLYGFGGKFIDEKSNPVFNDKHGIEALTWMVNSIKKGISNPASIVSNEEDVRHTFSMGKAAFAINWLYMYNLANSPKESKVAGQVKMTLIPASRIEVAKGIESATVDGSMAYGISAFSDHKEAAWKYLQYFCGKDVQKRYSAHMLPTWKSLLTDPELLKAQPVTLPMFGKQYPYAHLRPTVPYYTEFSKILQVAIQKALTREKSPEQALNDAVKEIKEIRY